MEKYKTSGNEAVIELLLGLIGFISSGYVLKLVLAWTFHYHVPVPVAIVCFSLTRWLAGHREKDVLNQEEWIGKVVGYAITPWIFLGIVWCVLRLGGM